MVRGMVIVMLAAGCRQVFGLDPPTATVIDADIVMTDADPVDATSTESGPFISGESNRSGSAKIWYTGLL